MSSVVLSGDTSGAITLAAPAVAGTNTITLPAATGTVLVSGNQPAFSAYLPSNQTITSGVSTVIAFSSKNFDTASCFNNTGSTVGGIPAYSFLPNVAGYYQFSVSVHTEASASITRALIALQKNGSGFFRIADSLNPLNQVQGSCLMYLNGSTDYVNITAYITATTATMSGQSSDEYTYFTGVLVRAA